MLQHALQLKLELVLQLMLQLILQLEHQHTLLFILQRDLTAYPAGRIIAFYNMFS